MTDFNITWAWIKSHWKAIVAGLGLLFGAIALALSRTNRVISPATALKIKKEAKEIAKKEARAETLESAADVKIDEIVSLENEIIKSKKRVAEIMHGPIVDAMTDEEIADLYRKSGL